MSYRSFASESKSWLCCRQGRFTHGIKGAACVVPPVDLGPWTLRRPNQAATRNSCHNNKFQNILESSYLQNTFEYLQTTLELCIFAILDFERSVALTERCQTSHLVNLCLDKHLLGLPQSTAIKYLAEQHLFGIACCLEDSLQSPLGSFIFPVGQNLANSHEVSTGDCNAKACSQKKALNKAGLCMNHEDHGPWTFDFELAPAWPNLLGVAHSLGLSGSKRSMSSSSFAFARPARTSGKNSSLL